MSKLPLTKEVKNIASGIQEELSEKSNIDLTGVDISELTSLIREYAIEHFDDEEYLTTKSIVAKLIGKFDESFVILDIGALIRQYRLWKEHLPRVKIHYAVKCNPDLIIVKTLASLGVGFDVASKGEIELVTSCGVDGSRIIYANPCKGSNHIKFARSKEVNTMTFDNKDELKKISVFHPDASLILRIMVDDITNSKMKFGPKFSCPMNDVRSILEFAKLLELKIVGVSFHVGSSCVDPKSYSNSIARAREVFNIAQQIGYDMKILDIGGGFPGIDTDDISFAEIAREVNEELDRSFGGNIQVIAEPGRFFATKAVTFIVSIHSKKSIVNEETSEIFFHYYIDSSIYGMFNNMVFDKARPQFQLLNKYQSTKTYKSNIFGETCDSFDLVAEGIDLPELAIGDSLFVENHGSYTLASSSTFNGFSFKKIQYIITY